MRPRSFISGNTCFKFSVQCRIQPPALFLSLVRSVQLAHSNYAMYNVQCTMNKGPHKREDEARTCNSVVQAEHTGV
jgi:hypothetical protein